MTAIVYTAKRRLIAGHAAGTSYSLETAAAVLDLAITPNRTDAISLSGTTEGTLHSLDFSWKVTTDHITHAELPAWIEFIASVAAAESFSFDAYGTIATPVDPQVVRLGAKHSIVRIGASMNYTISFSVHQVP